MTSAPRPARHPASEGSSHAPPGYVGRAFLYVLVAAGPEDLLKIGLTHDPLARWSSFHPRWFEAFDLQHSMLIETDSRAEAQALETGLHRALVAHHCPMPLTMRLAAGGGSEWYRGAYPAVQRRIRAQADAGHVVHWRAHDWLAAAMQRWREQLLETLHAAHAVHQAGWLCEARRRSLQDHVDALRHFDADSLRHVPTDIVRDLRLLG